MSFSQSACPSLHQYRLNSACLLCALRGSKEQEPAKRRAHSVRLFVRAWFVVRGSVCVRPFIDRCLSLAVHHSFTALHRPSAVAVAVAVAVVVSVMAQPAVKTNGGPAEEFVGSNDCLDERGTDNGQSTTASPQTPRIALNGDVSCAGQPGAFQHTTYLLPADDVVLPTAVPRHATPRPDDNDCNHTRQFPSLANFLVELFALGLHTCSSIHFSVLPSAKHLDNNFVTMSAALTVVLGLLGTGPLSLPNGYSIADSFRYRDLHDGMLHSPSSPSADDGHLDRVLFDEDVVDSYAAQCLDGSPAGYYIRRASTAESADKWVFFLKGGGLCVEPLDCHERVRESCAVYCLPARSGDVPVVHRFYYISLSLTFRVVCSHHRAHHQNICFEHRQKLRMDRASTTRKRSWTTTMSSLPEISTPSARGTLCTFRTAVATRTWDFKPGRGYCPMAFSFLDT